MSKKDDLMKTAKQDPLTAAKLCQTELEKLEAGYHEQLYYLLAVAYAIALQMQRDHRAWKAFIQDSFWRFRKKRPRSKHLNRALLHVLVFVLQAKTKQRYDRAQKYNTGLLLMMKKGTSPQHVLTLLRMDGIEVYIREASKRRKQGEQAGEDNENETLEEYFNINDPQGTGDEPSNGETSDDGSDAPKRKGAIPKASERDEVANGNKATPKKDKPVKLIASSKIRRQVRRLEPGRKARLTIMRLPNKAEELAHIVKFTDLAG